MSSIVSHLHTVLKDDVSLPYDQCCSLLLSWITEFDRSFFLGGTPKGGEMLTVVCRQTWN